MGKTARALFGLLLVSIFGFFGWMVARPYLGASVLSSTTDFDVESKHDEINGDITTAQKAFFNDQGSEADVTLSCKSHAAPTLTDFAAGMRDAFGGNFASALMGAKAGCPQKYKCEVTAEVKFFNDDKPAPLVAIVPMGTMPPTLVFYQAKNEATGTVYKGSTYLMSSGSTYYRNAIKFDVPTSGGSLSKWLYRFQVQQHDSPVDIVVDYSAPQLKQFVDVCNQQNEAPRASTADSTNGGNAGPGSSAPATQASSQDSSSNSGSTTASITDNQAPPASNQPGSTAKPKQVELRGVLVADFDGWRSRETLVPYSLKLDQPQRFHNDCGRDDETLEQIDLWWSSEAPYQSLVGRHVVAVGTIDAPRCGIVLRDFTIRADDTNATPSKASQNSEPNSDDTASVVAPNGHAYLFISASNITWGDAERDAQSHTFRGVSGHLATVDDKNELEFIVNTVFAGRIVGTTYLGGEQTSPGEWRWVTGPDGAADDGRGLVFYRGDEQGRAEAGEFANWMPSAFQHGGNWDVSKVKYVTLFSYHRPQFSTAVGNGSPAEGIVGYLVEFEPNGTP